jgi:hypothetical protein
LDIVSLMVGQCVLIACAAGGPVPIDMGGLAVLCRSMIQRGEFFVGQHDGRRGDVLLQDA